MNLNRYSSSTWIGGQYEIVGRPLMGGMGVVYFCFDHLAQHPVALKTFKPEYLPDRNARERFIREAATWVELGYHPHIVRAYKVQLIGVEGNIYLVLELVTGEQGRLDASLRSFMSPGQSLPMIQALGFAVQIARGMAYASASIDGFVHRDLKPENVLVGADRLTDSEFNHVRVTDFGLIKSNLTARDEDTSKILSTSTVQVGLTQNGSFLGTPAYMAPEQWTGVGVDIGTDIYAFGCILGEMLLGRPLVSATTLQEFYQAHHDGRALQVVQDLPTKVTAVLSRCLNVFTQARYRTWYDVEQALSALYLEETGEALPECVTAEALRLSEKVAEGSSYNALGLSCIELGRSKQALEFFERALQVGQAEGSHILELEALSYIGGAYNNLGKSRQAVAYFEQALAIRHKNGLHLLLIGVALNGIGVSYHHLGDFHQAISYHRQALTEFRAIGDRKNEGIALGNMANDYRSLGEISQARQCYEQRLIIAKEIGDRKGERIALDNLGSVQLSLGDTHRAIAYFEHALGISREIGDYMGEGESLGNLANTYLALGDARQAITYHQQALSIKREIGYRMGEGDSLGHLANAYNDLGDARRAIEHYEQQLAISQEIDYPIGEGSALNGLGAAYHRLGDVRRATAYYEQALSISREIGNRKGEGESLGNLANAYNDLGDARRAITYHEQALSIKREIGNRMGEGVNLGNLGQIYRALGDSRRGLKYSIEALEIFRERGIVDPNVKTRKG